VKTGFPLLFRISRPHPGIVWHDLSSLLMRCKKAKIQSAARIGDPPTSRRRRAGATPRGPVESEPASVPDSSKNVYLSNGYYKSPGNDKLCAPCMGWCQTTAARHAGPNLCQAASKFLKPIERILS
jgi:hypothetical protein